MLFPELAARVEEVRERIAAAVARGGHGQRVQIIAVTKTHGPEAVEAAFAAGLAHVGENRVQEALQKMAVVVAPVSWHLIGHLQRNKAKHALEFALVHSVDSLRLAESISEAARASGVRQRGLIQVNTSGEPSKGGFTADELERHLEYITSLGGLQVDGVMTMAPLTGDEATLRRTFAGARGALELLSRSGLTATELSMGMSNDYEVAIEEGATMVRLGTVLFGARTPWPTNPST